LNCITHNENLNEKDCKDSSLGDSLGSDNELPRCRCTKYRWGSQLDENVKEIFGTHQVAIVEVDDGAKHMCPQPLNWYMVKSNRN